MAATDTAVKSNSGQIAIIILVLVVVGVVFFILFKVFKGINGVLESVGLKDSADETKVNKTLGSESDKADKGGWFNPTYYKKLGSSGLQTSNEADSVAKQVKDSVGYLYDSPEDALGAIKQAKSKQQLSYVADRFNTLYGKDMKSYMDIAFDRADQKMILSDLYQYVNNLPKTSSGSGLNGALGKL